MKCEKCGVNEAIVYITKNINGKVSEMNICEECAKKLGAIDDMAIINTADFLSSFFSPTSVKKAINEVACPKCGTSLKDFSSSGYFGCSYCYEQFKDNLQPVIRRMHGKTRHMGKVPKGFEQSVSAAKEYERLSQLLADAIEEERYEEAAVYRDKLKKLSEKDN